MSSANREDQISTEQNNSDKTIKNWQEKLNEIQVPKTLLNKLVLNFLIVEGYKEGANKFIKEAGINMDDPNNSDLKLDFNEELMDQRMMVRKYILSGKIAQAINLINDINPEILDRNQVLNFELRKQQLIELIKTNNIQEAIKFSQVQIAPKCAEGQFSKSLDETQKKRSQKFQRDLEQAMTLMIFQDKNDSILHQLPPSLKDLVDYSNRQRLASHVNEVILKEMGYQGEHKLSFYWQMTLWSQKDLQKKAELEGIKKDGNGQLPFPILTQPMGELQMKEPEDQYMYDEEDEDDSDVDEEKDHSFSQN